MRRNVRSTTVPYGIYPGTATPFVASVAPDRPRLPKHFPLRTGTRMQIPPLPSASRLASMSARRRRSGATDATHMTCVCQLLTEGTMDKWHCSGSTGLHPEPIDDIPVARFSHTLDVPGRVGRDFRRSPEGDQIACPDPPPNQHLDTSQLEHQRSRQRRRRVDLTRDSPCRA